MGLLCTTRLRGVAHRFGHSCDPVEAIGASGQAVGLSCRAGSGVAGHNPLTLLIQAVNALRGRCEPALRLQRDGRAIGRYGDTSMHSIWLVLLGILALLGVWAVLVVFGFGADDMRHDARKRLNDEMPTWRLLMLATWDGTKVVGVYLLLVAAIVYGLLRGSFS